MPDVQLQAGKCSTSSKVKRVFCEVPRNRDGQRTSSRSMMADFIQTRCVCTGLSRAFAMSARARFGSSFSNSSLKAASQIASESALAANACAPAHTAC